MKLYYSGTLKIFRNHYAISYPNHYRLALSKCTVADTAAERNAPQGRQWPRHVTYQSTPVSCRSCISARSWQPSGCGCEPERALQQRSEQSMQMTRQHKDESDHAKHKLNGDNHPTRYTQDTPQYDRLQRNVLILHELNSLPIVSIKNDN